MIERKHVLLALPAQAVEAATFLNLTTYYGYHEAQPIAAILLSLAYSALLTASAVLVARPGIPWAVRSLLMAGVVALFFAQCVANISGAFIHGVEALPVEVLRKLWGEDWLPHSSFIFGGVINVVGLIYWLAFGMYLKHDFEQRAQAESALERFIKQGH